MELMARMRAAHAALVRELGLPSCASAEAQFSSHIRYALTQLGPSIQDAIRRCDGIAVAGRRFADLMSCMHAYARDVASVASGEVLGSAEFLVLAMRALIPGGVDAVLPRVLFADDQADMTEAYDLMRLESPHLMDDVRLLALVGGTPAAAAFLKAGGAEARERLAAIHRGGKTALEVLLDALQFGSFFHCGEVAYKHASAIVAEWERTIAPGAETGVRRSLHRLARSVELVGDPKWREMCEKAAFTHEKLNAPSSATDDDCRHAVEFWAEMHASAASVLTLGRHAAAKRQRRVALITWFFSESTLYVHARVLLRPGEGDSMRWVLSASLEAESAMRGALAAANKLPGGPSRSSFKTLRAIHSSDTRFDVPELHGDAATACLVASLKQAEKENNPNFFFGMGCAKKSLVSAIVTF